MMPCRCETLHSATNALLDRLLLDPAYSILLLDVLTFSKFIEINDSYEALPSMSCECRARPDDTPPSHPTLIA